MALSENITRAFHHQAAHCRRLGSPFTAHLCQRLPQVLDPDTPFGRRVADWPLDPVTSALALRVCGVLHRAVRTGLAPALAALYPPAAETGPALDAALAQTLADAGADLLPWLDSAPQTNEVARSAILLGGLLTVASETGLPLELNEIGSSAGLNLHVDCYAYDFGRGRLRGPEDAPLTVSGDWRGAAPPLDAPLRVAARAGADLAPLDPASAEARERMLGYIWPDQPDRLARATAALAHAAAHPAPVARAEAAAWVEARLARAPRPGTARVLMHSITWQYLPAASRRRIAAALEAAGRTARRDTPLAWLRLEPDGAPDTAAILLTTWPGGATRTLGRGDYHGRFADWAES